MIENDQMLMWTHACYIIKCDCWTTLKIKVLEY